MRRWRLVSLVRLRFSRRLNTRSGESSRSRDCLGESMGRGLSARRLVAGVRSMDRGWRDVDGGGVVGGSVRR